MLFESNIIEELEDVSYKLWQGKEVEVSSITMCINREVENLLHNIPSLEQNGIEFPTNYIVDALKNLTDAIEKSDDYLLADNLYYEWREIFIVYKETIQSL